jgi:clan AA aspartic protease (TIGR02281 family)
MGMRAWLAGLAAALPLVAATASAATPGTTQNEAGKAAYARGDYEAAERLFGEAIDRQPGEPLFHYHRAVALIRLGRFPEAATAYQLALRFNPSPDLRDRCMTGLRGLAALIGQVPRGRDVDSAERNGTSPGRRRFGPHSQDEGVAVPVRRVGGVWITDVVVNGARTARFLVDTGASLCVISPELAADASIGRDARPTVLRMQTLSGDTSGILVSIASLRVGEAEAEGVRAVIHDTGPLMDGILGNSFLGRYAATLDAEREILWLRAR